MSDITIQSNPSQEPLDNLGVSSWPIWEKEVSVFPWEYSATETFYVLEGKVIVTPEDEPAVEINAGDLVTFPKGMVCKWEVLEPIRKHYSFS